MSTTITTGTKSTTTPPVVKRTCRICSQQFTDNHEKACIYHPERCYACLCARCNLTSSSCTTHSLYLVYMTHICSLILLATLEKQLRGGFLLGRRVEMWSTTSIRVAVVVKVLLDAVTRGTLPSTSRNPSISGSLAWEWMLDCMLLHLMERFTSFNHKAVQISLK